MLTQFDIRLEDFRTELMAYALRLTKSSHDAEDLVQLTFQKALSNAEIARPKNLRPWLYKTMRNSFIDSCRKRSSRTAFLDSFRTNIIESTEKRPETSVVQQSQRELLYEWLECLEPQTAEMIKLIYLEGYKRREVADIMSIPVGMVKSRTYNGIQKIRREYLHMENLV